MLTLRSNPELTRTMLTLSASIAHLQSSKHDAAENDIAFFCFFLPPSSCANASEVRLLVASFILTLDFGKSSRPRRLDWLSWFFTRNAPAQYKSLLVYVPLTNKSTVLRIDRAIEAAIGLVRSRFVRDEMRFFGAGPTPAGAGMPYRPVFDVVL